MTAARPLSPALSGSAAPRRHALSGNGPIVDRARRALHLVAEQFGEVRRSGQTEVEVRTGDGITLTLSYDPGNYVFSRVYNLTITTDLPAGSDVPAGLRLSHRRRTGAEYVTGRAAGATGEAPKLRALNEVVRSHLAGVDLASSTISARGGRRTLTVTPLGGSFVWVLIPPVFKATAFPPGEPARILDLIRAVRGCQTAARKTTTITKGTKP